MAAMQAESRIGALWQQRMDALKEYDIVRDGNVFRAGLVGSCVFSSEYDRARTLLSELIDRYDGVEFDTLFPGREIENDGGSCIALESRHSLTPATIDYGRLPQEMLSDLTLVHGVGEVSERQPENAGLPYDSGPSRAPEVQVCGPAGTRTADPCGPGRCH